MSSSHDRQIERLHARKRARDLLAAETVAERLTAYQTDRPRTRIVDDPARRRYSFESPGDIKITKDKNGRTVVDDGGAEDD
jgi:hypothetical protein